MAFVIKYIKDGAFAATDACAGTLEDAKKIAADGLKKHAADVAAVMDDADMDGAPRALLTA